MLINTPFLSSFGTFLSRKVQKKKTPYILRRAALPRLPNMYNIKTEKEANATHYKVGSRIRDTIKDLGGALPEDLPTPTKSLKQIEKENKISYENS